MCSSGEVIAPTQTVTAAPRSWLAFWQWRRASIVFALVVLVFLFLLSVFALSRHHWTIARFGWPYAFVNGYASGRSLFSLRSVLEFRGKELLIDIAAAVVLSIGCGAVIEFRSRNGRRKLRQFTVTELFMAALAIAAALGWIVRENHRQEAALKRLRANFDVTTLLPYSIHRWLPNMPGGWLKPLDRVSYLHIMGGERRDEYFEPLAEFADVAQLEIEADFTDGALKHIVHMTNLVSLKLASPRLTGDGLGQLTGLRRLRSLRLSSSKLSDEGIRQLALLSDVELNIELHDTALSAAGFQRLTQMPELSRLTLTAVQLDADAIAALSEFRHVTHLTLDATAFDDDALVSLQHLTKLRSLTLVNAKHIGFKAAERLRKVLPDCMVDLR